MSAFNIYRLGHDCEKCAFYQFVSFRAATVVKKHYCAKFRRNFDYKIPKRRTTLVVRTSCNIYQLHSFTSKILEHSLTVTDGIYAIKSYDVIYLESTVYWESFYKLKIVLASCCDYSEKKSPLKKKTFKLLLS